MAGVPGFEPGLSVLETDVLTVDTIPLHRETRRRGDGVTRRKDKFAVSPRLPFPVSFSLSFFVARMLSATTAKLLKLQPIRRGFLVFGRRVVAALTLVALEHNVIARHNNSPYFQLPIRLFHYFRNRAGTHGAATFTNREP